MNRKPLVAGVLLAASLVAAGCGDSDSPGRIRQATPAQLEAAGLGELPVASARERVDLERRRSPTRPSVTNPLFPIASSARRS